MGSSNTGSFSSINMESFTSELAIHAGNAWGHPNWEWLGWAQTKFKVWPHCSLVLDWLSDCSQGILLRLYADAGLNRIPFKSHICLHVGCLVSIWLWATTFRSTRIVSSTFQSVYISSLNDLCWKLDFGISSDWVPWPSLGATLVLLFNTWWRYVSLRCLVNMGQAAVPHFQ